MYSYDCVNVLAQAIRQSSALDKDLSKGLEQVSTRGANGDERGFNERNHRVIDDDVFLARFQDMTFTPVQDDPLSATLRDPPDAVKSGVQRSRRAIGLLLDSRADLQVADAAPILLPSVRHARCRPGRRWSASIHGSVQLAGSAGDDERPRGPGRRRRNRQAGVGRRGPAPEAVGRLGDYTLRGARADRRRRSRGGIGIPSPACVTTRSSGPASRPATKTLAARVTPRRVKPRGAAAAASRDARRARATRSSCAARTRPRGVRRWLATSPKEARRRRSTKRVGGLQLGRSAPDLYARVPQAPLSQSEPIVAPLDVRVELEGKTYSIPARRRRADALRRCAFRRRLPGPKLRLTVTPVPPERQLTPPRGFATWAKAARHGRVPASTLLERISRVRLATARALQYQTFLANPDTTGGDACRLRLRHCGKDRRAATGGAGGRRWRLGLADSPLRSARRCSPQPVLVVLWANS